MNIINKLRKLFMSDQVNEEVVATPAVEESVPAVEEATVVEEETPKMEEAPVVEETASQEGVVEETPSTMSNI